MMMPARSEDFSISEALPSNLPAKKEVHGSSKRSDPESWGQLSASTADWSELNELSQASQSTHASTFVTPDLSKIFRGAWQEEEDEEDEASDDETGLDDLSDMMSFVQAGPLWTSLTHPPEPVEWARHATRLVALLLGHDSKHQTHSIMPAQLDSKVAVRVYQLYLPIYFWMREMARATLAQVGRDRRAVVLGLSAPQGCGKSTIVEFLMQLFEDDGMSCTSVSIDDFYLTGADQVKLADAHPSNAILQVRGNAGTHDVQLGTKILTGLACSETGDISVPVYDKAARSGKGDRKPEKEWRQVHAPFDVVLLEGWMSGFKSRGDLERLAAIHPALPEIDANLKEYEQWDALMDGWCVVKASDINHVFQWRLEAEQKMRAAGRGGMSDEAIRDFIARYMPAYEAYCPALHDAASDEGVDGKPTLLVDVDGKRQPVARGGSA